MIQIKNNRPMAMFSLFMATTTLATGTAGAVTIPSEPEPTILETIVSKATETISDATDGLNDEMTLCAERIDAYYAEQGVPLAGYGKIFAEAAVENGVDCEIATLAAAKGMAESTGGKHMPKKNGLPTWNAFGFGCSDKAGKKCKQYEGFEDAIETVIYNLSGNNPGTPYYKDKTITQIIDIYNPRSVVAKAYGDPMWYQNRIKSIMKKINTIDVSENDQLASR